MTHPDDAVLAEYAQGSLRDDALAALEGHMASCGDCREVVAGLLQVVAPPETLGPKKGLVLGRYVVLDPVGAGAIGEVFSAHDSTLERTVALKWLYPSVKQPDREALRARLLAEARALAKVQHPNVVVVHDVLAHEEADVIVMELVRHAKPLRDAIDGRTKQRELVRAFADAAKGLAAAHDAGVVHRDFKPDNVLVDASGRVVVVDFGLARDSGLEPAHVAPTHPRTSVSGTPAYLAPERWLRQPADARNDQYSFCVALYECLTGRLPFLATSVDERLAEMRTGAPALQVPVPPRLERALRRGLSYEPKDRWPSMHELGAELTATLEPARGTRFAAAVVLTVGAAVAILALGARRVRAQCDDAAAPVKAVWTAEKAAEVSAAFVATKHPAAEAIAPRVVAALEAYATELGDVRSRACRATAFEGESDATLTQRQGCTSRRLADLEALLDAFRHAEGKTVERAAAATESLAPAGECLSATSIQVEPMPGGASRAAVTALMPKVAQVKTLRMVGKTKESVALSESVIADARAAGWRPLVSEALHERSAGLERLSKFDDARVHELEALDLAFKANDLRMAFAAAVSLAYLDGADRQKAELGAAWLVMARALDMPGEGLTPERLRLANAEAVLAMRSDRAGEAATALAALEQELGRQGLLETVNGARLVANLSGALRESGKRTEAVEAGLRSLALMQKVLSPNHPDVAAAQNNLGSALSELNRFDEAEAALRSAIEIRERLYGPDAPLLATPFYNLGELALRMGNGQAAYDHYHRSFVIIEKAQGPDVDDAWDAKMGEGLALRKLGRNEEAVRVLSETLVELEKRKLPAWNIAEAKLGLAGALRMLKTDEARVVQLLKSVAALEGPRHDEQRNEAKLMLAATRTK